MATATLLDPSRETPRRDRRTSPRWLAPWLTGWAIVIGAGLFTVAAVGHTRVGPVSFTQWDASWYTWIATHGYSFGHGSLYHRGSAVYFPALPTLIAAARVLTDGNTTLAGMLIAGAATGSAARSLYRYTAPTHGEKAARWAVGALCCNPYAFVLFTPFTEPLLLACAIPALTAARERRWRTAGLLAAAAVTIRITGLFVALAVVVAYCLDVAHTPAGQRLRAALQPAAGWLFAPVAVFTGWTTYLHHLSGRWDTYTYLERTIWRRYPATPWYGLTHTWHLAVLEPDSAPEITAETIALAALIVVCAVLAYRRRWVELTYVAGPTLLLAATSYYSANQRGLLVAFPVYILAGARLSRSPYARLVLVVSGAGAAAMTGLYVTGLQFTG